MCAACMLNHFSCVWLCAILWIVSHQAPLSMGFSRQECWSGLPCSLPGDLPDLEIKSASLTSPSLAGRFFTTSPTWKAWGFLHGNKNNRFFFFPMNNLNSVQLFSLVRLFVTPMDWLQQHQASLSITNSRSSLKFIPIELVMLSNCLILCRPLLLPSIFSNIRVFSSESVLHIRWPNYWSFSFSISPSNEYSGLISFRIDWLDLFAVQGNSQESSPTPQFKNISVSVLSFLYGPTLTSIHDYWKNHSFD